MVVGLVFSLKNLGQWGDVTRSNAGAWILAPDEDVTQRGKRKEKSKNSTNKLFELNGNNATQDLRTIVDQISSFACPILF
jgi:hypothetical protein